MLKLHVYDHRKAASIIRKKKLIKIKNQFQQFYENVSRQQKWQKSAVIAVTLSRNEIFFALSNTSSPSVRVEST